MAKSRRKVVLRHPRDPRAFRMKPQTKPVASNPVPPSELTQEERQAELARQLIAPGKQRARLLAALAELDETTIRPLVLAAVEARIPQRRIAELASVSRVTVSRWLKSTADT
jgi:hypothetical protein